MTITTNDDRDEYTASGGQTVFNYTFKIYESTDLNVYQTPAGQDFDDSTDIITGYTVSGVGSESGGTITLNSGATNGDRITIVSDIPSSRTTDYQNNGDFKPVTVNEDFDRVVSLVKQVEGAVNRSVLFPESAQGVSSKTLPFPVSGKFLRWNNALSGLENADLPSVVVSESGQIFSVKSYTDLTGLDVNDLVDGQSLSVTNPGIAGEGVIRYSVGHGITSTSGVQVRINDDWYWERNYDEVVLPEWFGLEYGVISDQLPALQAAINEAEAGDGMVKLQPRKSLWIDGTVTLSSGVVLDCQWSDVRPLSNVNVFTVRPGATLKQCRGLTSGITFSSKFAVLAPTQNTLGAQLPPWIDGLNVIMGNSSGGNTGDAVSYDSSNYWIQEMMANDICIYFGRRAVDNSTSESGLFCNGNVINGLITHNSAYTIYEDANNGTCAGNIYSAVMSQGNNSTYGQMRLNSGARVDCLMWDGSPIDFINDNNFVTAYGRGQDLPRSDMGLGNKIINAEGVYESRRSTGKNQDWRNNRYLPGRKEFRDMITGGVDPRWTQNISAGGSITYANYAYGSSVFLRGTAAVLNTGTTASDITQLHFGGQGICRAAQAPMVHATVRTSSTTADRRCFVGLYADANNYIGFEIDPAVYGDVIWRAVSKSGGTSTLTSTLLGTSARVGFFSVIVTSNKVEFYAGIANDNNDKCANGVLNFEDGAFGFSAEHTTNIPSSANLEPTVFCQTQSASAKLLSLLDFQFSSSISEFY